MSGGRKSTFSRTLGLVVALFLGSLLGAAAPTGAHHLEIEGLEAFITVTGNSTDFDNLFFDKTEIILGPPPVFVNITFVNIDFTSDIPHNFTIVLDGFVHTTPLLRPGETGWMEFFLNRTGNFPYWCRVPGHREAGMVGTFVVTDTGQIGGGGFVVEGVALRAHWIGLIGIFSMVAVIIVSYFVIKYESPHHTDHREHRRRGLP